MVLRFLPDPGLLGQMDPVRAGRLLDERARLLARRSLGGGAGPWPEAGVGSEAGVGTGAGAVLVVALYGEGFAEELFGLPLDRVAAVMAAEPACPLPGSPAAVLGLRARAGRMHAVLDLAALLGMPRGRRGHDVLLRPLPRGGAGGALAGGGRRLALRVGRALLAAPAQALPGGGEPVRAGSGPGGGPGGGEFGGVVGFRATIADGTAEAGRRVLGVLDLDRLLRAYAVDPIARSRAAGFLGSGLAGSDPPGSGFPDAGPPDAVLPGAVLPGAVPPGAGLPGAGLPGTELPGADLPGAGLPGARLPVSGARGPEPLDSLPVTGD